jgi:hypothetical protein
MTVSATCVTKSSIRRKVKQMSVDTTSPIYPDVHVQLVGQDGNAFAIMGRVQSALEDAGATKEEIEKYLNESMSGDYDNLLRTAMKWVSVS